MTGTQLSLLDSSTLQTKRCPCCGEIKPIDEFYKNKAKKDNRNSQCKVCERAYQQSEAGRASRRASRGKRRGDMPLILPEGVTEQEYVDLQFEKQDGLCAITGEPLEGPYILEDGSMTRKWFVDHCHATGAPRGLIKNAPNAAVGKLGDTLEGVSRALLYLEANCPMTTDEQLDSLIAELIRRRLQRRFRKEDAAISESGE